MANIPANLNSWSITPASNQPDGTDASSIVDDLRQIQATVRQYLASKGSTIASAATVDMATANGFVIDVSGTATITSLGTLSAGMQFLLRFTGACTLTHNATSLILPSGANITTANGDAAYITSLGSGNWQVLLYQKADGRALVAPNLSAYMTSGSDGTGSNTVTITSNTTLSLAAHSGKRIILGAGCTAINVPVTRGFNCTIYNSTGVVVAIASVTGSIVRPDGTTAIFIILPDTVGGGLHSFGDGTNNIITQFGRTIVRDAVATNEAITLGQVNTLLAALITKTANTTPVLTTGGAAYTVAHALGRMPNFTQLEYVCLTAELGYAIGDVVQIQSLWNGSAQGAISIWKSPTQVGVQCLAGYFPCVNHKTTGAYATPTPANWAYRFVIS